MPAFVRAFLFKSSSDGELSYKVKNAGRKRPHGRRVRRLIYLFIG